MRVAELSDERTDDAAASRLDPAAPRRRRLRPFALALILPVGFGAVAGVFGLRAHFAGTAAHSSGSGAVPAARADAVLVWDAAHHVDVLFGGSGDGGPFTDTWTWDGTGWQQLHPADSPPPMATAAAAFDPDQGRLVLVGEPATSTAPGSSMVSRGARLETWSWDGGNWEHLFIDSPPGLEAPVALAYDAHTHRLLLAGVAQRRPIFVHPAPAPDTSGVPSGPIAVPDPAPGYSPPSGTLLGTDEWTGAAWKATAATLDVDLGPVGMAWDSARQRVTLVQAASPPSMSMGCAVAGQPAPGGMMVITPGAGPAAAPTSHGNPAAPLPPGTSHVVAPVPALHTSTVPLPICSTPSPPPNSVSCTPTTCPPGRQWSWDGTAWQPLAGSAFLGTVGTASLATNPVHDGLAHPSGATVWGWDGKSWSGHRGSAVIPVGAAIAPDADRHVLVAFGGRDGWTTSPRHPQISNQTFTWDGSAWTLRAGGLVSLPTPSMPAPSEGEHPVVDPGASPLECTPALVAAPSVVQELVGGVLQIDVTVGPPAVVSNGSMSCFSGRRLDIEIDGANGQPLRIHGNPTVEKTTATHVVLHWSNWCGSGPATLSLKESEAANSVTSLRRLPACSASGSPSELVVTSSSAN
jgi:hypothetical protein